MLKERDEVCGVSELLFNEIKNQFYDFIHVLRTDNALEYVKNDVSSFCSKNGIIHQTSYSHAPRQNDIVESKHRYILDVVRTIIIHIACSKIFVV